MLMSRQPLQAEQADSVQPEETTSDIATTPRTARQVALQQATPGRSWRIAAIDGGLELQRALARLGLRPGLCIEVAQHTRCGPVVVAGGLKLALGAEAARQLLVEPCEDAAAG